VSDDPNSVADALDPYHHPAIDAVIDGWEAAELVTSNPSDSAPIHGAVSFLSTLAAAGFDVTPEALADRLDLWQSNTEGAIADAGDLPGDLTAWSAIRRLTAQRDDLAARLAVAEAAHLATYETVSRRADAAESRLAALTDAIGNPDELRRCVVPLAITVTPMESMYVRLCRIADAAAAVQPTDPKENK
jgi:hypothetical protein